MTCLFLLCAAVYFYAFRQNMLTFQRPRTLAIFLSLSLSHIQTARAHHSLARIIFQDFSRHWEPASSVASSFVWSWYFSIQNKAIKQAPLPGDVERDATPWMTAATIWSLMFSSLACLTVIACQNGDEGRPHVWAIHGLIKDKFKKKYR